MALKCFAMITSWVIFCCDNIYESVDEITPIIALIYERRPQGVDNSEKGISRVMS